MTHSFILDTQEMYHMVIITFFCIFEHPEIELELLIMVQVIENRPQITGIGTDQSDFGFQFYLAVRGSLAVIESIYSRLLISSVVCC